MSQVKYYLESSKIAKTEVTPTFSGIFEFSRRDEQVYYIHECKDKMKFITEDYDLIMVHIDDICDDITIIVEQGCGDEYTEYWRGTFKLFSAERNDPKYLEVKPEPFGVYECFETAIEALQSPFSEDDADYVTVYGGHGTREIIECVSDTKSYTSFSTAIFPNAPDPYPSQDNFTLADYPSDCVDGLIGFSAVAREIHKTLEETRIHEGLGTYTYIEYVLLSRYVRWSVKTDCVGGVPTPPDYPSGYAANGSESLNEWQLIEDDCAGTNKTTWRTSGTTLGEYKRGRLFQDIIVNMVADFDCGLTVVSNFFDINPDNSEPDNIAYQYAVQHLHDLTLHQKSDIKRKDASNHSKVLAWEFIPEDLLNDLAALFNVYPIIRNNVLFLEHYSYFVGLTGWDVSHINVNTKIDNTGNDSIKTELFNYADKNCSASFKATQIEYNCGDNHLDRNCKLISVDVGFIENINNESDIKDEGFVLISNAIRDGQYVMNTSNSPLRWNNLLENLHLHGRPFKSGELGGVQQDFLSWRPFIKAEAFTVPYCCDDVFDPSKTMITKLGEGELDSAEHNIITDTLKPKLLY